MDIFKSIFSFFFFFGKGKTGLSKKTNCVFASKHKVDQLESSSQSTGLAEAVSLEESHPTDIWQHFIIVSAPQRLSVASSAL